MKNVFYTILLVAGLSVFCSCSSGVYSANPGSVANSSVNPLHPLDSAQFNWGASGTNPMSATINGTPWVATGVTYSFDSGKNTLYGYNGSNQVLVLYLTNDYKGNIYSMGYQQYNSWGYTTDSVGNINSYYQSVLGNSGEVQMLEYDANGIKGLFYFQGVTLRGDVINVTNGYFYIPL